MRKFSIAIVCLFGFSVCHAQKTEVGISLNSGLFSFTGESAKSTAQINYGEQPKSAYTNNPYGSKNGLGLGLSGYIKRVSSNNFIVGLDGGYELLRSKIEITKISEFVETGYIDHPATGKTYFNLSFINVRPFIGYRINANKIKFDITAGTDIAFCLSAEENGEAVTSNGLSYTTSLERKTITTDLRPGVQIGAQYKDVGVYIGYSSGISNYLSGYIGGSNEAYSRLLRFGLTYQIR